MQKKTKQLPALCAAVRRVRAAYGESQEQFARRAAVVMVTVSRFETGQAEPKEPRVLWALAKAAAEKNLPAEEKLFREALDQAGEFTAKVGPLVQGYDQFLAPPAMLLSLFRLLAGVRQAYFHCPELIPGVEAALAPVLEVVDEALRAAADPEHINQHDLDAQMSKLLLLKRQEQRKKDQTQ
jgi:transcriptional regulator with XRE-family HTH domain